MTRRPEERERERRERELQSEVTRRARRRLAARRERDEGVWFWLGMFGLVGWSIAIPTVVGTAIGLWLDGHFPGQPSWTITLMLIGVLLGCLMAWRWIREERVGDD